MDTRKTDRTVQLVIGRLLRIGVYVAAAIALIGGVWYLALHGGDVTHYAAFRGEPDFLRSVGGVFGGIAALRPEAVIQLGLLLLIAVPILRVAVSVVAFAIERDWLYVVVTLLVLGVLIFSLLGGAG
ncbi:MAG TPA: DUF1634 domain-containing protein [Spirochaetia bacterium]